MEEKKKRGGKKVDSKGILEIKSSLQEDLHRIADFTTRFSSVIQKVTKGLENLRESIIRSMEGIRVASRSFEEIDRKLAQLQKVHIELSYIPQLMEALNEAKENAEKIIKTIGDLTNLENITLLRGISHQSNGVIDSLCRYITFLENELKNKERELAEKEITIKELKEVIKYLEKTKKELIRYIV